MRSNRGGAATLDIACTLCSPESLSRESKTGSPCRSMKLNKRRVNWLIRQEQKGVTSKDLAVTMKLSRRRVEQIWKRYRDTGQEPLVGVKMGPPTKAFDAQEARDLQGSISAIQIRGSNA